MIDPPVDVHAFLTDIWRVALDYDEIEDDDNFFELGGESRAAALIVSRIREDLGAVIELQDVFEAGTLAALVKRVAEAEQAGPSPWPVDLPVLGRRDHDGPVRAALAQEWYFLLSEDPSQQHTAPFLIHAAVRVSGSLDVARLRRALAAVSQRHDLLRTRFQRQGDQVVQRVEDVTVPLDLVRIDPAGPDPLGAAEKVIKAAARRQFGNTAAPLARCTVAELSDTDHILLVVIDHRICDGVSLKVFMADLATAYARLASQPDVTLPPPPIRFSDWAWWQRERLSRVQAALADHWRSRLGDDPRVVTTDFVAYQRPSYEHAVSHTRMIEGAQAEALHRAASARRVTMYALMLAGFVAALRKRVRNPDFCVVTTLDNRQPAQTAEIFGPVAHDAYLRIDPATPSDVDSLAQAAQRATQDAVQYALAPNTTLWELIWPSANLALLDEPAFYFGLYRPWVLDLRLDDAVVGYIEADPTIPMPGLECTVYVLDSGLFVEARYLRGGFPDGYVADFVDEAIETLLSACAEHGPASGG